MSDDRPQPWDIVECVDAGPIRAPGAHRGKPSGLTLGGHYTVDDVHPQGSRCPKTGRVWQADFVRLKEASHPDPRWDAYPAKRFRLVERADPSRFGPWGLRR